MLMKIVYISVAQIGQISLFGWNSTKSLWHASARDRCFNSQRAALPSCWKKTLQAASIFDVEDIEALDKTGIELCLIEISQVVDFMHK